MLTTFRHWLNRAYRHGNLRWSQWLVRCKVYGAEKQVNWCMTKKYSRLARIDITAVVYMYNNRCLYINTAGIIVLANFVECIFFNKNVYSLLWRHNEHDSISNHQPHDCLLNRLFRRRSKETSKARVTGLCAGNSPETGEFPAQMASNAEKVSIWWRHHGRWRELQECFL